MNARDDYQMTSLYSIAIFVGTGQCNAYCDHCAGLIHRRYAPKEDGNVDEDLITKTLKESYMQGARRLSITGSGEPTLSPRSVSKVLEIADRQAQQGMAYNDIHMYSNGIRIGEDKEFCDSNLPAWRSNGLKGVYVTVHDIDMAKNASIYGVKEYPPIQSVLSRIHDAGLYMRANLILSKNGIDNLEKFVSSSTYLKSLGVDAIAAWPIRGMDDKLDIEASAPDKELDKMDEWIAKDKQDNIAIYRENHRMLYQTSQKLTLFPDGSLSNMWCK